MLRPGIYEQLIDRRLAQELDQLPENQKATAAIDQAEASSVLSQYVADVVRKALERMHDGKSELPDQVALVNQLVAMVGEIAEEDIDGISVDERAQQLLALIGEKDPRIALGKSAKDVVRPETSLAQSSLFTGAVHEPQMFSELKKEIASADRIDMLVSTAAPTSPARAAILISKASRRWITLNSSLSWRIASSLLRSSSSVKIDSNSQPVPTCLSASAHSSSQVGTTMTFFGC